MSEFRPEDVEDRPWPATDKTQPWVPKAKMGPYRLLNTVKLDVFITHGLELELPQGVELRMRFAGVDEELGVRPGITVTAWTDEKVLDVLVGTVRTKNSYAPAGSFTYSTNLIPIYEGWNAFLMISVVFPGAGLAHVNIALWERPE